VPFCQNTREKLRHKKIFTTTAGRNLLAFPVNCIQSIPGKSTQESAGIFRLYSVNITGSGGYPAKSRNINQ
jgi:hypothetical protein